MIQVLLSEAEEVVFSNSQGGGGEIALVTAETLWEIRRALLVGLGTAGRWREAIGELRNMYCVDDDGGRGGRQGSFPTSPESSDRGSSTSGTNMLLGEGQEGSGVYVRGVDVDALRWAEGALKRGRNFQRVDDGHVWRSRDRREGGEVADVAAWRGEEVATAEELDREGRRRRGGDHEKDSFNWQVDIYQYGLSWFWLCFVLTYGT